VRDRLLTMVLVGATVVVCFLVTTGGSALALEQGRLTSIEIDPTSALLADYAVDGQRLTLPALNLELTEAASEDARERRRPVTRAMPSSLLR
jgi:hypothetical protein